MSISETFAAMQCIGMIDNTSLNETDTEESIEKLIEMSMISDILPACLMIYSKFVPYAKKSMGKYKQYIPVGTVINFPHGSGTLQEVKIEAQSAIDMNVEELDMVMNYKSVIKNVEEGLTEAAQTISEISKMCKAATKPVLFKVILESGELQDPILISKCTMTALEAGADYVKTSTGKVKVNATLQAALIMAQTINDFLTKYPQKEGKVGLKIAGGIKTLDDALRYIIQTQLILGTKFTQNNMRLGTSSLLKLLNNTIQLGYETKTLENSSQY